MTLTRDILVDLPTSPSPLSFGDTVVNPSPLECHVLFDWPLITDPFSLSVLVIMSSLSMSHVNDVQTNKVSNYKRNSVKNVFTLNLYNNHIAYELLSRTSRK